MKTSSSSKTSFSSSKESMTSSSTSKSLKENLSTSAETLNSFVGENEDSLRFQDVNKVKTNVQAINTDKKHVKDVNTDTKDLHNINTDIIRDSEISKCLEDFRCSIKEAGNFFEDEIFSGVRELFKTAISDVLLRQNGNLTNFSENLIKYKSMREIKNSSENQAAKLMEENDAFKVSKMYFVIKKT